MGTDSGLTKDLALRSIGTGVNYAGAVAAYSGREAMRLGLGSAEMDNFPVLWVFPADHEVVRQSGVSLWAGLSGALEGLGRWRGITVAVYSRLRALQVVDDSITDVPDSAPDKLASMVAQRVIDEQVIPANIGRDTPFFLLI